MSMETTFKLAIGNALPEMNHSDVDGVTAQWTEAAQFIQNRPFTIRDQDGVRQIVFQVSLEVDSLLKGLAECKRTETVADPFAAELRIVLQAQETASEKEYEHAVVVFVQHLFLLMNLSYPGSCRFLKADFSDRPDMRYKAPSLNGVPFKNAQRGAVEFGWPVLRVLPVAQTWHWLELVKISQMDVAFSPSPLAVFSLLDIAAQAHHFGSSDIIQLYQVILSYCDADAQMDDRWVRQRLHLILGQPNSRADSFSDLHRRYCQAIEGQKAAIRPGIEFHTPHTALKQQLAAHNSPVERALMIILALLQDLITHQAKNYEFAETFNRHTGSD